VWWPHLSVPSGLMSMKRFCIFDFNPTADNSDGLRVRYHIKINK
jgi:hypothetical protein